MIVNCISCKLCTDKIYDECDVCKNCYGSKWDIYQNGRFFFKSPKSDKWRCKIIKEEALAAALYLNWRMKIKNSLSEIVYEVYRV